MAQSFLAVFFKSSVTTDASHAILPCGFLVKTQRARSALRPPNAWIVVVPRGRATVPLSLGDEVFAARPDGILLPSMISV